ncbi:MAG: hypothetical protein Q8K75_12265 [Chlamydiales bacterium]|nr:hypothetical protein [Chlamydiales bacterium]
MLQSIGPTSAYQKLQDDHAAGKLQMTNVIALPRAHGTAVELILTQGATGQINEPFSVFAMQQPERKYTILDNPQKLEDAFQTGCTFILQRMQEEGDSEATVKLVTHDISQTLTLDDVRRLARISNHTVFVFRDPGQHMLSMLTRYTNDQWATPLGDALSSKDVLALMADGTDLRATIAASSGKINESTLCRCLGKPEAYVLTDEDLQLARQQTLTLVSEEFSAAWENLYSFVQDARVRKDCPYSVFEGEGIFEEEKVKALVENIGGLEYSQNMIKHWTIGVGDQFRCVTTRNMPAENAWNGPVRHSTGVGHKPGSLSQAISSDLFPAALKEAVEAKVVLYRELKANQ